MEHSLDWISTFNECSTLMVLLNDHSTVLFGVNNGARKCIVRMKYLCLSASRRRDSRWPRNRVEVICEKIRIGLACNIPPFVQTTWITVLEIN